MPNLEGISVTDALPSWAQPPAEQRAAEDLAQAKKLIEEAEKRRKREEEEREKAITADLRLRSQGTNQRD